ncbi:MAG: 50S ribosomal protein L6 [Verrucomicrobia bacterium]|nr:50S ribosomal protein L6 [Verrucomicrobiota bacterium]
MSRIGKKLVAIPPKVKVSVSGCRVMVEGPRGKLDLSLPKLTDAKVEDGSVFISRVGESSEAKAMHGLARALVNNLVKGVTDGFSKKLEIQGVGFKAAVQGKIVNMALGYSHPILYPIPDGIKVTIEENTKLSIEGIDKELVGRVASELRSFYPPEPYKGKGVRYVGEKVIRKEGKTVQ